MRPDGIFATVQLEVAQRMTAAPADKSYGLLSILMQATGDVRLLRTLNPQAFWPQPKVRSAMFAWHYDEEKYRRIRCITHLKRTIDALLGHRRKKISYGLAQLTSVAPAELAPVLASLGIDLDARGETLSPGQFVALANHLVDLSDSPT